MILTEPVEPIKSLRAAEAVLAKDFCLTKDLAALHEGAICPTEYLPCTLSLIPLPQLRFDFDILLATSLDDQSLVPQDRKWSEIFADCEARSTPTMLPVNGC